MPSALHDDLGKFERIQNTALLRGAVTLLICPLPECVRLFRCLHAFVCVYLKLFLRSLEVFVHPEHAVFSGQCVYAFAFLVSGHHEVVVRALTCRGYLGGKQHIQFVQLRILAVSELGDPADKPVALLLVCTCCDHCLICGRLLFADGPLFSGVIAPGLAQTVWAEYDRLYPLPDVLVVYRIPQLRLVAVALIHAAPEHRVDTPRCFLDLAAAGYHLSPDVERRLCDVLRAFAALDGIDPLVECFRRDRRRKGIVAPADQRGSILQIGDIVCDIAACGLQRFPPVKAALFVFCPEEPFARELFPSVVHDRPQRVVD